MNVAPVQASIAHRHFSISHSFFPFNISHKRNKYKSSANGPVKCKPLRTTVIRIIFRRAGGSCSEIVKAESFAIGGSCSFNDDRFEYTLMASRYSRQIAGAAAVVACVAECDQLLTSSSSSSLDLRWELYSGLSR